MKVFRTPSLVVLAAALIVSGFFVFNVNAVGDVTITRPSPEDLTIESTTFRPAIGSTLARNADAYYSIRSVSSLAETIPDVRWKITIEGPAGFIPNMVDLDEAGWKDPDETSIEIFHYPFAGSGTLVATGSCTNPDPVHDNGCATDTFDVDPNDNFTNVDKVRFNTSAPLGTYTIKRQLVDIDGPVSDELTVATIELTADLTTLEVGTGKPYTSIQAAIDDATSGDTIQVAAGTYTEPIQTLAACGNEPTSLCIDKPLTLRGDPGDASAGPGSNAPVLDGSSLDNGSAIALLRDGNPISNVTIEGFVIRNYTNPIWQGGVGSGVIAWNTDTSNIIVQDNSFEDLGWNGVLVGSDNDTVQSGWTVQNNVIDNAAYAGIELTNVTDSTVSGNVITVSNGNWDAGDSGVGIEIAVRDHQAGATTGGTNITVSGNTITGGGSGARAGINLLARAYNVAGTDAHLSGVTVSGNTVSGVTPRGIYAVAETRNAAATASIETLTITGNTISSNGSGLVVKDFVNGGGTSSHSGIAVNNNSITGNTIFGVNVENGNLVDATDNFWGAASGPNGDGDAVSGNVDFRPWLLEAGGATYDQTIALTEAGQWAIVSAPQLLSELPVIVDDGNGAVSILAYVGGQFIDSGDAAFDTDVVKPVSAFFVKPTNKAGMGFNYDPTPGPITKTLISGWNLIGTNNDGVVQDELSSIQNTEQVAGMLTLFAPDTYNARKESGFFTVWAPDANHDLNAYPISGLPDNSLSSYDGYWVNMSAAKDYSKIQ